VEIRRRRSRGQFLSQSDISHPVFFQPAGRAGLPNKANNGINDSDT
jgi:hypothetical protein